MSIHVDFFFRNITIFLHYISLTVHLPGVNGNDFLSEVKTFTDRAGKRAESLAGSTTA